MQNSKLRQGKITSHCESMDVFQVQSTPQRPVQDHGAPALASLAPAPYGEAHAMPQDAVVEAPGDNKGEVVLTLIDTNLPGIAGQSVFVCASLVGLSHDASVSHNPNGALGDGIGIVPQFTSAMKTGAEMLTPLSERLAFSHRMRGGTAAPDALEPIAGEPLQIFVTLHASAQPGPAGAPLAQAPIPKRRLSPRSPLQCLHRCQ